jgi:hypothetical protein
VVAICWRKLAMYDYSPREQHCRMDPERERVLDYSGSDAVC